RNCSNSSYFAKLVRGFCLTSAASQPSGFAFADEPEREAAAEQEGRGQDVESAGEVARLLLHIADDVGADETADVADRIHQRDAACGGGAAQKFRRHAPERSERAPDAERREAEREKGEERRVMLQRAAQDEADRAGERRQRDVPAPLAGFVRMIADQN